MKIPKTFLPEREELEQEIGDIVKKTLVEKVLVENLAKELETYFDNKNLAQRIEVHFEKKFDISRNPDLNTQLEKAHNGDYILKKDASNSLQKQATDYILNRLKELNLNIKEEEITHTYINTFSIVTKETAYKLFLDVIKPYNDEETIIKEVEKKGIRGKKMNRIEETYRNIRIQGEITYAKFDKTHHETLLKILKDEGYLVSIDVKKEK